MATLTQSDLGETAAKVLKDAGERPVMIVDGDREVGAIVSMSDYEVVRRAKVDRLFESMSKFGELLRADAAEHGISLDELEKMLDRKAK